MALYELSTVSAEEFAQNPYIAVPFFQRKSTWFPRQRLGLALSIFRGYPIGTVVVKETGDQILLLDGRQRRETLQALMDPARLASWARTELRVESGGRLRRLRKAEWDDRALVIRAFREYANLYFFGESDIDLEQSVESPETDTPLPLTAPSDTAVEDTTELPDADIDPAAELHPELSDLFQIIWLGRTTSAGGSRTYLDSLFDFSAYLGGLDYIIVGGERDGQVDSQKLMDRLRDAKNSYRMQYQTFPPPEADIPGWITDSVIGSARVEDEEGLATFIQTGLLQEALRALDKLDRALRSTSLGYVKIHNAAEEADDMKVFSLINTAGTQLTGPEVLCATPSWNISIPNPPQRLREDRDELHRAKGVLLDVTAPVRRWDKAATVLDRIDAPLAYGRQSGWPWDSKNSSLFDTKINFGFRLLTGLADGKMMKNDMAHLAQSTRVHWDTLADEDLLNRSYRAAVNQPFFRYLLDWTFEVRGRISEYLAHAFLLLAAKEYELKGGANAPLAGASLNLYRRNALIRFDRWVFEYISGTWRHAADSRVARELRNLTQAGQEDPQLAEPLVSPAEWSSLVDEIIENGTIQGDPYTTQQSPDSRAVLLLFYANAIAKVRPNPPGEGAEVDHIIPQALFRETEDAGSSGNRNHIANLALLNPSINNYKSDRRLNQIEDGHRREEIARLTLIPKDRFPEFISVAQTSELRSFRGGILAKVLTEKRAEMLADPRLYYEQDEVIGA